MPEDRVSQRRPAVFAPDEEAREILKEILAELRTVSKYLGGESRDATGQPAGDPSESRRVEWNEAKRVAELRVLLDDVSRAEIDLRSEIAFQERALREVAQDNDPPQAIQSRSDVITRVIQRKRAALKALEEVRDPSELANWRAEHDVPRRE